jgi:predicted amidophosphoribosyltransferase
VTSKTPEIRKDKLDLFSAFTKPQKLTEEEVSISIEKKICLVCKGELSRKNYICPECKTFYCIKCSDALLNMENACWVCNTPFNESKPSKPFEIIETDVGVDIKDK